MGYHPRIETSEISSHITSKTREAKLWFINNKPLEAAILGYIAKHSLKHQVHLYAFGIEGNHIHQAARFPKANRASYTRDTNSLIAKAVDRHCDGFSGGRLWHRRYSAEYMSHQEDIEKYFFYIALQPVNDGLVDRISDYPGYNFFNDAVSGIKRKFKVFNQTRYSDAVRYGSAVNIKDFYDEYELVYQRLPGYEHLSQSEYKRLMHEKLEHYRQEVLIERAEKNKNKSLGKQKLKQITAGSSPRRTKSIGRFGHRPRVLATCHQRRHVMKGWYFQIYFEYKEASAKYREGDHSVEFPPGTYKPPKFTCACHDTLESLMAP